MASSKRKTIPQRIVHLLTPGMPQIVKNTLGSRLGAPLVLGAIIVFAASGVISVQWLNGRPRVSIDRERVASIKQTLGDLRHRVSPAHDGTSTTIAVSSQIAKDGTTQLVAQQGDTIRIASFNIQVFGTSKAGKPEIMNILAQIVRRFDVVAIQELRTTDSSVIEGFIRLINAQGAAYQYIIGPRLGRSDSKEQYVFVFDSRRIEVDPNSVQTVDDPKDLLHREPLIARFRTRASPSSDAFTFILANIHTDPDETKQELDALGDVFQTVQRNPWGEDDVIMLGDLNVSHEKLGALGQIPGIAYTVHGEPTNTRGTKSYDNIVFSGVATAEYIGQSGIIDLQSEFGLTTEQALKISDHHPIWAEFGSCEYGSATLLANQRTAAGNPANAVTSSERVLRPTVMPPNAQQPVAVARTAAAGRPSPVPQSSQLRNTQGQYPPLPPSTAARYAQPSPQKQMQNSGGSLSVYPAKSPYADQHQVQQSYPQPVNAQQRYGQQPRYEQDPRYAGQQPVNFSSPTSAQPPAQAPKKRLDLRRLRFLHR